MTKKFPSKWITPQTITQIVMEERAVNSRRKREGLTRHPVHYYNCPCGACGGWSYIDKRITIPTAEECVSLMKQRKQS